MNKNGTSFVKEMISKWHLDRSVPAMIGQIVFFSELVFPHDSHADIGDEGQGTTLFLDSGHL